MQAEPYSAYGNMAAEGIQKLMGAPSLDRLHTLIRETAQNSSDAALDDRDLEYRLHVKSLTAEQTATYRQAVFGEFPPGDHSCELIESFLYGDSPTVLEVSDWHTSGLAGPTRPDVVPPDGEPTDFLDFVRNVGSRRDTHQGSGTYGFGKASLFMMSRCRTIVVDTQTTYLGEPVRRLIAIHIGEAFDIRSGDRSGRYTGRHWWGKLSADGMYLEPVVGDAASSLALKLGLDPRASDETGTSIVILDPILETDTDSLDGPREEPAAFLRDEVLKMGDIILWNFWPRMVPGSSNAHIRFKTLFNGEEISLPDPMETAPFDLFAESLAQVRKRNGGATAIRSERPQKLLGHTYSMAGRIRPRHRVSDDDPVIPRRCFHMAIMRPRELVVRYLTGPAPIDQNTEWAGVFVCDVDEEVERAFAASEPPAHDDWVASYLEPRSRERTFVNVALREIKKHINRFGEDERGVSGTDGKGKLAPAAGKLGRFIGGVSGDGVGGGSGGAGGGGGTGRRPKSFRVSQPKFEALEETDKGPVSVFSVRVTSPGTGSGHLTANANMLVEGGLSREAVAPSGEKVTFLGWEREDGSMVASPSVSVTEDTTLRARVSMPDYVAVTMSVRVEGG